MKKPKSKDSGLADTLKELGTRFALMFFIIVTLAMLFLGKSDPRIVEKTRAVVIDDLSPVMSVLSEPVTAFHRTLDWAENVAFVFRENERLREENRRLKGWQALAQRMAVDDARFRALLRVQPDQAVSVMTARVIADTGGSFVRSIIIDGGARNGVVEGQPVLDDYGVAGRVVTVGGRSARVLLVTDLNSRVPVKIAESGFNAILAGDNLPMPKVIFLPMGAEIQVGDHILTSGHGGIFPPDLAVGKVASISKSGEIRVVPAAQLGRLNYVRLFSFVPTPPPADAIISPPNSPPPGASPAGTPQPGIQDPGSPAASNPDQAIQAPGTPPPGNSIPPVTP